MAPSDQDTETVLPALRYANLVEVGALDPDIAAALAEKLCARWPTHRGSAYRQVVEEAVRKHARGASEEVEVAIEDDVPKIRDEGVSIIVDYPCVAVGAPTEAGSFEGRACLALCTHSSNGTNTSKAYGRAAPNDSESRPFYPVAELSEIIVLYRSVSSAIAEWTTRELESAMGKPLRRGTPAALEVTTLTSSDRKLRDYLREAGPYGDVGDVLAQPGAEAFFRKYLGSVLTLPPSLKNPHASGVEFLWFASPIGMEDDAGTSTLREVLYLSRETSECAQVAGIAYADPSDRTVSKRSSLKVARFLGVRL